MADKLQMIEADLGKDVNAEVEAYVYEQLEWMEQAHKELHLNKLPRWRKLYLGVPQEMTRNFPFPNAANTIVQVIGETTDAMVARVMGLLYATHPLWVFKNYAKAGSDDEKKLNETKKQVVEDFMDLVGFEPSLLNLQEAESLWYTDAAKLGTSFLKIGMEKVEEAVAVGYGDGQKIKARVETIYEGPTVTKLRHEDVYADPKALTLDKSDFVAVRRALNRQQLEERMFTGAYSKEAVEKIMSSPDRAVPREQVRTELQEQGISAPNRPDSTAEWDIFECYFGWWAGNPKRKFRLMYTFHKRSKTVMRRIFNPMPKNDLPVKRAKLGYRTDGLYGHGYAELLETYQEELSTTHNQRLDNATVANVRALRVSPHARTLDANTELYPGALIVGEKDDIESIQVGDVYPSTFKSEEMTMQLVARRSGITPAVAGAGSGSMGKRPAVYSSQGTLAVMQENNSQVGFATAEFRHAHVMLGSALASMYGKFGTNGLEEAFGLDGEALTQALKEFTEGKMRIPIRAATGSLNKETEKQAGMLMAGVLQRHYTAVGQLLQAIANPMVPPQAREYFTSLVVASEMFHKKLIKDFGYEQPDLYVPEAKVQQPQNAGAARQAGGGPPMGGNPQGEQGGGGGILPRGDMANALPGVAPVAGGGAGPR